MPMKSAPFAGGYDELSAQKLKAVSIPNRIKCMVCKKSKNPSMFSGKQLSDLRFKIYRFGQGSIPAEGCIKCEQCTGKQRTEMKCCRCDKVRPLDKFSLAQRRKKDEPVCMACQEDVDWLAPDERDFTTGPDDAVHEDYESDYSDTSSQVYEITESGEYAVSDAATNTDTASQFSTSDTDGGGVRLRSGNSRSTPLQSLPHSKPSSSVRSDVQPTTKVMLTRNNLKKLSALSISDSQDPPSSSCPQLPSTSGIASGANAWNRFARVGSNLSMAGVSGVWVAEDASPKGSTASSAVPSTNEVDDVWTGEDRPAVGVLYNAFDPLGRAHERQQSLPSMSSSKNHAREPPRSNVRDKGAKFPRVRPTPAVRPKKLDMGDDEEGSSGMRVAGYDYFDDDNEEEFWDAMV